MSAKDKKEKSLADDNKIYPLQMSFQIKNSIVIFKYLLATSSSSLKYKDYML